MAEVGIGIPGEKPLFRALVGGFWSMSSEQVLTVGRGKVVTAGDNAVVATCPSALGAGPCCWSKFSFYSEIQRPESTLLAA